jgi:methyl-accepting chemotaxis protein
MSNYLLDKKLQLRYVLVVTILSGLIAGSLGYLIYQQRHTASASIEQDLMALDAQFHDRQTDDLRQNIPAQMAADDRNDVLTMIGVGVGLVVILTGYLLIMTHKVAGPLFKISMYFDRMAEGRIGNVTALRKGDMLQEFFQSFRDMHEALRARLVADNDAMEKALASLRESKNQADYRGEAHGKLDEELDLLDKHIAQRKKQLA